MNRPRLVAAAAAFLVTAAVLAPAPAQAQAQAQAQNKQYVIGFSQLAFDDPWRVAFNNQMQRAVAKHPNYRLVLVNAQRDSAKQVADVDNLMTQKVDALIISPNEAAPLTAAVKRAYDKGIPVIVLDRNVLGDGYTMFIGADNRMIGQKAGEYVARWCLEKNHNPCSVLEVTGLSGSTPAQERAAGFREGLKANPNARVVTSVTSEWQKAKAVPAAAAAFQANKGFNVVYAHNDDSTEGAYIAAKNANADVGRMLFVGIDGLPDKNGSIVSVMQGRLGASFVYPNGAAEAVDWISRILEKKEKPPKKIVLGTEEITPLTAKAACAKFECEAN